MTKTPDLDSPPDAQDETHDGRSGTGAVEIDEDDHVSVLELLSVLLKHRYSIVVSSAAVAVIAVAHLLVTFSPTYTSSASFMPEGAGSRSGLEAMADRFGLNVPSAGSGTALYLDLLGSREVLRPILDDTFSVRRTDGGGVAEVRGTLLDLLEIDHDLPEAERKQAGLAWLRGAVSASASPSTGVLTFSVTAPWPEVAAGVAERLLERVNEFNVRTRQSQAAAERVFVEARLEEAREKLIAAEEELKRFLEANRQFRNSPELVFEHERLQRQVAMRQQLFTGIGQAYEQARISEVRNTPLITVLESPEEPLQRNPRGLKRRGVIGLVLGGVLGVLLAFGREYLGNPRGNSEGHQKLREAWREAVEDVRRVLPRSRRRKVVGASDEQVDSG